MASDFSTICKYISRGSKSRYAKIILLGAALEIVRRTSGIFPSEPCHCSSWNTGQLLVRGPFGFFCGLSISHSIVWLMLHSNHDLLSPPLRPLRPKRTLGGTNFRADIVDASSSTSASKEWEGAELPSVVSVLAAASDSDVLASLAGMS